MIRPELQKKIDRAVKLLRSIPLAEGEAVEVSYSGGKDSDVILQLVKESGIKYRAIYKNTTIDPPGTYIIRVSFIALLDKLSNSQLFTFNFQLIQVPIANQLQLLHLALIGGEVVLERQVNINVFALLLDGWEW